MLTRYNTDPKQYILDRVKINEETGCWEWQMCLTERGYGRPGINGKAVRANRLSYEIFVGSIPKGKYVCHDCDVPSCVNPNHLWIGSPRENAMDMIKKGRHKGVPLPFTDVQWAALIEHIKELSNISDLLDPDDINLFITKRCHH